MKPNFALTLSFEGIGLLHRHAAGWENVGHVAFDTADLAGALDALRKQGLDRDPDGIQTKLVLPDDQIKFLSVPINGHDPSALAALAQDAIEGETPYGLDELAVAYHQTGDGLQIAAVARETLAEAEAFAKEHQFNPVSFVANPGDESFAIEPFFGITDAAPKIFGGPVTPDEAKIVIAPAPVVEIAPTPTSAPDEAEAPAPVDPSEDMAVESSEEIQGDLLDTIEATEDANSVVSQPVGDDTVDYDAMEQRLENELAPALPLSNDELDVADTASAPISDDVVPSKDQDAGAEQTAQADRTTADAVTPTPETQEPADVAPAIETTPVQDPSTVTDNAQKQADILADKAELSAHKGPSDGVQPIPSFSTVRATDDVKQTAAPTLAGASREDQTAPRWMTAEVAAAADQNAVVRAQAPEALQPAEVRDGDPEATMLGMAASLNPMETPAKSGGFFSRQSTPTAPETELAKPIAAPLAAPKASSAASAPSVGAAQAAQPPAEAADTSKPAIFASLTQLLFKKRVQKQSEKQRLTVFGAREVENIGGKPKFLGLILMSILLVFMIAMAAYASLSQGGLAGLFRWNNPSPTAIAEADVGLTEDITDAVSQPELALGDADDVNLSVDTSLNLASLQPVPSLTDLVENPASDGVTATDVAALDPEGAELQPEPELTTAPQTQDLAEGTDIPLTSAERYAATGIWEEAPTRAVGPEPQTLDDFYITSIDRAVPKQDAVALPSVTAALSDISPNGQSNPAVAGTDFALDQRGLVEATPEGTLNPDGVLVYAGRPAKLPPARNDVADAPLAADGLSQQERSRIAAVRPQLRPEGLKEETERTLLGGRTRSELAQLRPKTRPQNFAALTEELRQSNINQGIQTALLQSANGPLIDLNGTGQSAISPRQRPKNLGDTAQKARAQAASVTPSIPSTASVSRQATLKNQLNLRKVNLIGVYGQSSNLRAMVRLANGRYKKVQVGDRIDGGKVAAIGKDELRYIKSGRTITLKMPKG